MNVRLLWVVAYAPSQAPFYKNSEAVRSFSSEKCSLVKKNSFNPRKLLRRPLVTGPGKLVIRGCNLFYFFA